MAWIGSRNGRQPAKRRRRLQLLLLAEKVLMKIPNSKIVQLPSFPLPHDVIFFLPYLPMPLKQPFLMFFPSPLLLFQLGFPLPKEMILLPVLLLLLPAYLTMFLMLLMLMLLIDSIIRGR